jgi:hypothetical protein
VKQLKYLIFAGGIVFSLSVASRKQNINKLQGKKKKGNAMKTCAGVEL